MKYIRTKDGIYRTTKNFVVGKEHYVAWHDFYEEIIKQADTIEELCDEFVAIHKTFSKTYCIRKVPFEKQDENFNIYGAIWTNKGLIYVAKMNDKGVLEYVLCKETSRPL